METTLSYAGEAREFTSQCNEGVCADIVSPDLDRPLIFRGKILHTRIFPQYHSFTYPYLMVWIPIHSNIGGNTTLSIDNGHTHTGWLQVKAKDHLHRENSECGLRHKLDLYLKRQVSDWRLQ